MLFMCQGKPRPGLSPDDHRNALKLFGSWQPPAGLTIKGHYIAASGGDFVIVEAESAEPLIEATATWAPFVVYEVTPIAEVQSGITVLARAEDTRAKLL
jgi:hypothetical protein